MKVVALVGSALSASVPANQQWQGTNIQGDGWSAQAGPAGVSYQESGFSLIASPSAVTTNNVGISTYCVDETPACDTQKTEYFNYVWDSASESLSATGKDNNGGFSLSGVLNTSGDGYDITKTYTSGPLAFAVGGGPAVFTILSSEVPTDANYFFSEFTFTSNINRSGHGRFAAAFVENVQVQPE